MLATETMTFQAVTMAAQMVPFQEEEIMAAALTVQVLSTMA